MQAGMIFAWWCAIV